MSAVNEVERRLVAPFYLKVLHGNVVSPKSAGERDAVLRQMRAVAGTVSLDDAVYLWARGWRASLMASWWAAVWRWPEAVDQVGRFLIPSRNCFEGQAHCLVLAQVNSGRSREVLIRYLDEYLPRVDLDYDQPWALAALTLACRRAGQSVPDRFQAAWYQWSSNPYRRHGLGEYVDIVGRMMALQMRLRTASGLPPDSRLIDGQNRRCVSNREARTDATPGLIGS
jgi:Family of unknown function (DUF6000)